MESASGRPWLVIYTKPRQEKKLAERLRQAGYEIYLPTQRQKKRWSDRWKWVDTPLIPSHLFIQLNPHEREAVHFFPGFVRFLFWLHRPAQVPHKEITLLKAWLNDVHLEAKEQPPLTPGQKAKVLSGPFQGEVATVQEVGARTLSVYFQELQMKIQLDLSRNQIEVLPLHAGTRLPVEVANKPVQE